MAIPQYDPAKQVGVLERVVQSLATVLERDTPVDIIEFAESPEYLNQRLFPRQRLILKLYYRVPLSSYACHCGNRTDECNLCLGTGVYDEFQDVKRLLSCTQKYAKLYFPGLCEHHVTGTCTKDVCHHPDMADDYRILSDAEILERLSKHHAHILEVIAGRRGSKSVLGAIVNAYSLYLLLRDQDPHTTFAGGGSDHSLIRSPIGTANVAADERQALILFGHLKAVIVASPWFQRLGPSIKWLENEIVFLGRSVYARSFHSNSASVRGNTLLAIFLDEFCFFNKTTGKLSDTAMVNALFPSVVTFGPYKRIVITSSPYNMSGEAWNLFDQAARRQTHTVIALQLATWEMNPTVPKTDSEIQRLYDTDEENAEVEFGGQWANSVGQYMPPDAVDRALNQREWTRQTHGKVGVKYCLHIDLSQKRDRSGSVICHYDRDTGRVVIDQADSIDPKNPHMGLGGEWVNDAGEIDHEKVFQYVVKLRRQYKFQFHWISFDQFNSQWLLQALRREFNDPEGKWIQQVHIKEQNNREFYANLRSLIVQGGIIGYPNPVLNRELKMLSKTIKPSGLFKIEASPGETDDVSDALSVCAYQAYALALGYESSIVVVKPTEAEAAAQAAAGVLSSEFPHLKHKKGCTVDACTWGCAVARKRQEVQLGVEHLPGCTETYCAMMCPVQAKLTQ